MQRLEEKTEGAWRPSPGSVYPTLQLLEDEGLARASEQDGKRVYEITDAGREEAARRIDEAGGAPWDEALRGDGRGGGFPNARLRFTAPQDGDYRVIATSFDGKTGRYTLEVAAE